MKSLRPSFSRRLRRVPFLIPIWLQPGLMPNSEMAQPNLPQSVHESLDTLTPSEILTFTKSRRRRHRRCLLLLTAPTDQARLLCIPLRTPIQRPQALALHIPDKPPHAVPPLTPTRQLLEGTDTAVLEIARGGDLDNESRALLDMDLPGVEQDALIIVIVDVDDEVRYLRQKFRDSSWLEAPLSGEVEGDGIHLANQGEDFAAELVARLRQREAGEVGVWVA